LTQTGRARWPGRYRLIIGVGLIGVVVLLALGVGRFLGSTGPGSVADFWRFLGLRVAPPVPAGDAPAEAGSGLPSPSGTDGPQSRIAAGAEFTWETRYDLCGCTESDTIPAESGLIGLDRRTLSIELRDWEIRDFAPTKVNAARSEKETMCPRHNRRSLRLEAGKVTLYAGDLSDPAVKLLPLEVTSITEDILTSSEIEILMVGRSFGSQDEAVRYLEGLGD
jgi:hypothetical protein